MKQNVLIYCCTLLCSFSFILAQTALDIKDDFTDPKSKVRQASRGEWKYQNNTTSCVSDPELYIKYKNHGPIIRWPATFVEGTIAFEMKAKDCQRVVFTLNGDGHIFRIGTLKKAPKRKVNSRIIMWATKSSKTNKGDTVKPEGLPTMSTINDQWVKYVVSVKVGKATVQIGDFKTEVEHDSLKRDKKEATLSFAEGEIAIRNFSLTSPPK